MCKMKGYRGVFVPGPFYSRTGKQGWWRRGVPYRWSVPFLATFGTGSLRPPAAHVDKEMRPCDKMRRRTSSYRD